MLAREKKLILAQFFLRDMLGATSIHKLVQCADDMIQTSPKTWSQFLPF